MPRLPQARKDVPTWWGNETFKAFYDLYSSAREHALFFVGAGLSRSRGLPSWSELITKLLEGYLDKYPRDASSDAISAVRELLVAGGSDAYRCAGSKLKALYDQGGKERWRQELSRILDTPHLRNEESSLHRSLVSLPWQRIITTNYDGLIEYAYYQRAGQRAGGIDLKVMYPPNIVADNILRPPYKRTLIKLHGSIVATDSDSSLVLTDEEYSDFYKQESSKTQRATLGNLLTNVGVTLFLGYRHSDLDVKTLFLQSLDVFRESRLFAVVPRHVTPNFRTELAATSAEWKSGLGAALPQRV